MPKVLKCNSCQEEVQPGVVRCWNCGSFMRDDIAEAYLEMKSSPSDVILSTPEEESLLPSRSEDDFEIASPILGEGTIVDHTLTSKTPVVPIDTIPLATAESSITKEESEDSKEKAASSDDNDDEKVSSSKEEAAIEAQDQKKDDDEEDHSVATGGDEILAAAMAEAKEDQSKKEATSSKPVPKTRMGIIVFCPNGHPIEVQERHRGKVGKCPKCRESFNVPAAPPMPTKEEKETTNDTNQPAEEKQELYWMTDIHLHEIDLQKLSLKPGSLEKSFKQVDIQFSKEGMLVLSLVKGAGLFGSAEKKKPALREDIQQKLTDGVSASDCGAAEHFQIESPGNLSIVQPAIEGEESLFGGIPILGEGRIGIQVPREGKGTLRFYLSFSLSEFRAFSTNAGLAWGLEEYGKENSIPLEDLTIEKNCYYTDAKFDALENLEYYQKDPNLELEISGRECQECGLEISEQGRKKENIGGKTGKGIAKVKCPKCAKKFGDKTFYKVKEKTI